MKTIMVEANAFPPLDAQAAPPLVRALAALGHNAEADAPSARAIGAGE